MSRSITKRLQLISLFFIVTFASSYGTKLDDDEFSYRLPNNTRPETFDLSLRTWIDSGIFDFTGKLRIRILTSNEASGTVTLHTRQLTVNSVTVQTYSEPPKNVSVTSWNHSEKGEFLTIILAENLLANSKYVVGINYNGTLRWDQGGFYRSSYHDRNGKQRWDLLSNNSKKK